MSTNQLNDLSKVYLSQIAEETPGERIDRISSENVADRKAKAESDRTARDKKTEEFQRHKQSVLAKGGRPVDALDSWHRKQAHKEAYALAEKDLNAAERRALPDSDFALPGKGKGPEGKQAGSYPIPDKSHARLALAMVAKHGSAAEKAKVRAAVEKKFPGIKIEEGKDTPDQVKAVIAYDRARKGTRDATYDSMHGKKKQAKKERDYAKWQRDKGAEDAQKSGHPWEHAKGSTREKEGKKSVKHAHIKDSFSNWRNDLREIAYQVETPPEEYVAEPQSKAEKEVKEKRVKNKIVINPTFQESIREIGGEVLDAVQINEKGEPTNTQGKGVVKKELQALKKGAQTLKGKYVAKADEIQESDADEYIEIVTKVKKSELEADIRRWSVDEAVKGEDTQKRKDAAAERRQGIGKLKSKKAGESYAKWTMRKHPASVDEDKKWGYDKDGNSLNPADIEKRKRKEDDLFGSPNSKKKAKVEEQSNPGDARPQSPTANKEDPGLAAKKKKQEQLKKQVLLKKLQAVRQGSGSEITASYEPDIEGAVEYFYEEGINEDGLQMIIEEVGLEDLVDFVEERSARKMNVRTKGSMKKQIEKDSAAEAKRRAGKTGEYKETPKKKAKVGGPSYATKVEGPVKKMEKRRADDDLAGAPLKKKSAPKPVVKKVAKAVAKAKPAQPKKEVSKGGLRDKLKSAYKAGVKRHRKATQPARIFHKGLKSGARTAVKAAKDVKKAVVGEELAVDTGTEAVREKKKKTLDRIKKDAKDILKQDEIHRKIEEEVQDIVKGVKKNFGAEGLAKKKHKEKFGGVAEAKVDVGKTPHEKETARNKRNTPAGGNPKFDRSVFITRKSGESLDSARGRKRREAHAKRRGVKEDKAFDNVVASLRKKHGESGVLTKDSPKTKATPQPQTNPEKETRSSAQREVDAQYGRTPWNKKGSLGT